MRNKKTFALWLAAAMVTGVISGLSAMGADVVSIDMTDNNDEAWAIIAMATDEAAGDDGVVLYDGPSDENEVLGHLYRGGAVEIVDHGEGWTEVEFGEQTAFVHSDQLIYGTEAKGLAERYGEYAVEALWNDVKLFAAQDGESEIVDVAGHKDLYRYVAREDRWLEVDAGEDQSAFVPEDEVHVVIVLHGPVPVGEKERKLESYFKLIGEEEEETESESESESEKEDAADEKDVQEDQAASDTSSEDTASQAESAAQTSYSSTEATYTDTAASSANTGSTSSSSSYTGNTASQTTQTEASSSSQTEYTQTTEAPAAVTEESYNDSEEETTGSQTTQEASSTDSSASSDESSSDTSASGSESTGSSNGSELQAKADALYDDYLNAQAAADEAVANGSGDQAVNDTAAAATNAYNAYVQAQEDADNATYGTTGESGEEDSADYESYDTGSYSESYDSGSGDSYSDGSSDGYTDSYSDTGSDGSAESSYTESSDTGSEATTSSSQASSSDVELLAALIYCEAGNQPYDGQVAVGSVVMNRVSSGDFPDSISEVINQSGQFTPSYSGALSQALADGSGSGYVEAAQEALAGADPTDGSLYFNTSHGSGTKIGDHWFY